MQGAVHTSVQDAESAAFDRRSLMLRAAAVAGLPGRFESFRLDGVRVSMATDEHYGFLNIVEGVDEQSIDLLPEALEGFPDTDQVTVLATSPSPGLIEQLLGQGYEPAPVRPIAYLCTGPPGESRAPSGCQIREVSSGEDAQLFLGLLVSGYAASREVSELIRTEHALSGIRRFIAYRDGRPVAAAAMSVHSTGVVLGGASTMPAARGFGAQSALLMHRLRLVGAMGVPLATATAAPGTPSIRNLARVGFTIVERRAWRHPGGSTKH
jgi:hypothetical protein